MRIAQSLSRVPEAVRPKLANPTNSTVNMPRNTYEQDADRAADLVLHMTHSAVGRSGGPEPQSAGSTHEIGSEAHVADVAGNLTSGLGQGAPLDTASRAFFEPRFGHDFAKVRVYADDAAAEAASSLGARAYTRGSDIVFGKGEFDPRSLHGKRLLAHELAHIVQQRPVVGVHAEGVKGSSFESVAPVAVRNAPRAMIYREPSEPEPGALDFERVGNEAGTAGAKGAIPRLERLVSGAAVTRALAAIPITDAAQKNIVIQQILSTPEALRKVAEAGNVRFLSQEEYENGIKYLGFPGGASAFADPGNDFLYITPLGTPSGFVLGHEVSHIQTGPVRAAATETDADAEMSIKLGMLNTEIRAAFVDFAFVKLQAMHQQINAGASEDSAVAAFAQDYSSEIFTYITDHGSVGSALGKLAVLVSERRGKESVPTNGEALKKAAAKGYVSEADLPSIFSHEPNPFEMDDSIEIDGL